MNKQSIGLADIYLILHNYHTMKLVNTLSQRESGRPRAQARGGGEGGVLSLFGFFSSPSSIAVWALGFDAAGFPIASCGSQRFPGPPFSRPRRLVPGAPEFCFRQQSPCRHCARPRCDIEFVW
jgi:hypothetical protein